MWDYLDKMDKNLLYSYALLLASTSPRVCFQGMHTRKSSDEEVTEQETHEKEVQDRNIGFYLIWFVYRYILNCRTLDEALARPMDEALEKYRLKQIFISGSRRLYIGIDRDIQLYKPEDMPIILEILYKRLGFWEQLDLFIEKAGGKNGKKSIRQTRCLEAKNRYMALLSASGQEMMQG